MAIVDTSTLNANVFFELGVRHALKKSLAVLIRGEGTTSPFNNAGMSSIEYGASGPRNIAKESKRFTAPSSVR